MSITLETKKEIVAKLSKLLVKYSPPMVISSKNADGITLIGNKQVPYGSKKQLVPGMFFVSVVTNKTMVSFHFFPMYYNEKTYLPLAPNSLKYLKGKTCFNFTTADQVDEMEMDAMLKRGVEAWVKNGYMHNRFISIKQNTTDSQIKNNLF